MHLSFALEYGCDLVRLRARARLQLTFTPYASLYTFSLSYLFFLPMYLLFMLSKVREPLLKVLYSAFFYNPYHSYQVARKKDSISFFSPDKILSLMLLLNLKMLDTGFFSRKCTTFLHSHFYSRIILIKYIGKVCCF